METNFYTDEFEQLIKEKADQFRMYPSRRVWHSIYNNLHPSRRWPSFAMSIFLITSLLLIGHLNTSDNVVNNKFAGNSPSDQADDNTLINKKPLSFNNTLSFTGTNSESLSVSEKPNDLSADNSSSSKYFTDNNTNIIVPVLDNYINTNQLFTDVAAVNEKNNPKTANSVSASVSIPSNTEYDETAFNSKGITIAGTKQATPDQPQSQQPDKLITEKENAALNSPLSAETNSSVLDEKAWIENFALHNTPPRNKLKGRLDFEFYATPAVNYRKLTTESKGSTAPFATTGDINRSISQRPGLGIEAGMGLSYSFAKNLRLKAGVQFNYTNYNINADKTNHPIITTVLYIDPNTGYSYPVARTSTISNAYDANALQPVTLHNRTYQISIPVGLAYKLSSHKNVEWFAGATVQPSYIFGGNAHLISADLKSYVSEPGSIRNWNLNLGFETYMSYKLGAYSLRVGPQLRYQVYSTYRKDVSLIEKPYAVGLKFGIVKGF